MKAELPEKVEFTTEKLAVPSMSSAPPAVNGALFEVNVEYWIVAVPSREETAPPSPAAVLLSNVQLEIFHVPLVRIAPPLICAWFDCRVQFDRITSLPEIAPPWAALPAFNVRSVIVVAAVTLNSRVKFAPSSARTPAPGPVMITLLFIGISLASVIVLPIPAAN